MKIYIETKGPNRQYAKSVANCQTTQKSET